MVKFLIDECLSLDLVDLAGTVVSRKAPTLYGWQSRMERLAVETLHPRWRLDFVTRDSVDFRGPAESPGIKGQYADVSIHAGLVCMNGPAAMNLELQCELFSAALDEIGNVDQLVNEVIEVDLETPEAEITIRRYTLPD